MRILVTGGTGVLGSGVVRCLTRDGHDVSVLSRGAAASPVQGVRYFTGSVLDSAAVTEAIRGAEVVVHLAAETGAGESVRARKKLFDTNVRGTTIVRDAAVRAHVGCLVHASSASVYGSGASSVVQENAPLEPVSTYGASKAAAEDVVRQAANRLEVRILRFGALYGPRSKGNYQRLLRFLARQPLLMVGERAAGRSLVHEDDAARAVALSVRQHDVGSPVYNVTDGGAHTLGEIVAAMDRALGRRRERIWIPVRHAAKALAFFEGRLRGAWVFPLGSGDLMRLGGNLVIDSRLIQRELGFVPEMSLTNGIQSMVFPSGVLG